MAESNQRLRIEDRARELAEPLLAQEGLELLELEFVREQQGWVLRLFIDQPGGSVGVNECGTASRAVDKAFEVEDFIPHEYNLEVSTPGLNRPLKKKAHFESVVGQQIRVKTFGPVGEPPRKSFLGALKAVKGDTVEVDVEGAGPYSIPLKDIARANLEYQFEMPRKP